MTRLLKNIFHGARWILVLQPDEQYVIPARGGFRRDAGALRGDARKIAADLRKTVKKYGEQVNHG